MSSLTTTWISRETPLPGPPLARFLARGGETSGAVRKVGRNQVFRITLTFLPLLLWRRGLGREFPEETSRVEPLNHGVAASRQSAAGHFEQWPRSYPAAAGPLRRGLGVQSATFLREILSPTLSSRGGEGGASTRVG